MINKNRPWIWETPTPKSVEDLKPKPMTEEEENEFQKTMEQFVKETPQT